ncbi:hypothetical protein GCM10023314_24460 [Algibacter agarivorans]|uniref:Secretion system C-terminal sorting domain-containing protein n=2 Tax=Algibacter agarivorans TaxID=1109741 RepID=A0ABP9GQQ5_9FLAO
MTAQVVLENEIKITDLGLHFDGSKVGSTASNTGDNAPYDYFFGRNISAHGDAIKTYGDYVFMTWYRGGKADRHVMLTRYNTKTGSMATIEFPHRHTGYQNQYWIGESHNTIAIGVSPLDGTIHLLYDMHAYSASRPSNGSLANDYFRYSYSVKEAASLPDADFTLDKFVKNSNDDYKHLRMPGTAAQSEFVSLTYPRFFQNDDGDLFMLMREGGNNNGMYKFIKYDTNTGDWGNFIDFNRLNAKSQPGIDYNWGLYGDMKYVNGKFRIGFQRRSSNNNDKYLYQNGVYYAYSDDQTAATGWKNHKGESFSLPLWDADFIKVMEPGDYVATTQANKVHIVGGFDWTVTANEDVHIISQVRDLENNVTKTLHTYRPSGASEFITSEDFSGGSAIYTSGNSIFLIGLNSSGRIFIEKAVGGTNNFTKVYEATSGRTFDHGVVHIDNGKVYYYLMEDKTGNAQPLYLQIIDLDIIQDPFRVSLTSPSDGETYNVDDTVQISANAVDENGSISKVEFWVNGTYFGEDNSEPYSIDWTPTSEAAYTIQAVAYNASNDTVISTEITVNATIFDPNDLTGVVYRLRNVATGKYLKSSGSNVVDGEYVQGDDAINWNFVKVNLSGTEYYNIVSKVNNNVLRGAGSGAGNAIIITTRQPPNTDVDKVWTAHYIEAEQAYRFAVKDGNNFLYHEDVDEYYNKTAAITDARSKWKVELANSAPLSIDDKELASYAVKVYPNPANGNFNIVLDGFYKAEIVINDMLGKVVYKNTMNTNRMEVQNNSRFKSGLYLIKIIDDNQRVFHAKLIIR